MIELLSVLLWNFTPTIAGGTYPHSSQKSVKFMKNKLSQSEILGKKVIHILEIYLLEGKMRIPFHGRMYLGLAEKSHPFYRITST